MQQGTANGSVRGCPRGIYRDRSAPAGLVVLKVISSTGRRMARLEFDEEVYDDASLAEVQAWLDRRDPVDGSAPALAPPVRLPTTGRRWRHTTGGHVLQILRHVGQGVEQRGP